MFEIKYRSDPNLYVNKSEKKSRGKLILITWLACGGACEFANFKFYDEKIQVKKNSYNAFNKYIKPYFSTTNLPFIMKMNTHSTS